jgi:N6-adenosine-specific RNA methylase IME4
MSCTASPPIPAIEEHFVPCSHCSRVLGPVKKGTLRLHERDCMKNPERRTWHCATCDKSFPHGSGLSKHMQSRAHADPLALPVPLPSPRPVAPQVVRPKADPPSRKRKTVDPPFPRTALVVPNGMCSYNAAEHPLLQGVPDGEFSVIMADPPFRYQRRVGTGVAENHYETMSDEELWALPVGQIAAKTALLLLWCSGPTMSRAIELCKKWGFTYKTVAFVWIKTNKRAEPQSMGLGYYTRPGTEFVLVATKGRGASLIAERPDQVFAAPRQAHSEKPHELRAIVHSMTGRDKNLRKLELFSRAPADTTWSVWGDQVPDVLDPDESFEAFEPEEAFDEASCVGIMAKFNVERACLWEPSN